MKKLILLILLSINCFSVFAQVNVENGHLIPAKGTLRALIVQPLSVLI